MIARSLLRTATNPANGLPKKNIMLPTFTAMDAAESPNHPPATVPEGFCPPGKDSDKRFLSVSLDQRAVPPKLEFPVVSPSDGSQPRLQSRCPGLVPPATRGRDSTPNTSP